MKTKVRAAIAKFNLFEPGDRVIIGLSGGADSISLTHVLLSLREEFSLTIFAAHVNHLLRGEESDRDEEFVRMWCAKEGIPLAIRRVDIGKLAQESGRGTEECGREVRYAFFEELAALWDAKITTAHTLSDSIETGIFNLARGTGITGFCGIPAKRGRIIRPLIEVTRREVKDYCAQNSLQYMTDSTNKSNVYARNRIRNEVIPALYSVNSGFDRAFLRFTERLKSDDEFLFLLAQEKLDGSRINNGYRIDMLEGMPESILSRCLRLLIAGKDSSALHIHLLTECIRAGSGSVTLPDGRIFVVSDGCLVEQQAFKDADKWSKQIEFPLTECPNGKKYVFKLINLKSFEKFKKVPKKVFINCLDYDMINSDTLLRARLPGDSITPALRNISKTVKKLLIEEKIPQCKRGNLAVLESGGDVVWVEGVAVAESVHVTEQTKRILFINVIKE